MSAILNPLTLDRAAPLNEATHRREKALRVLAASVLHLLPIALFAIVVPMKSKPIGGSFGQSVSVTLVSGAPARSAAPPTPRQTLTSLQQRLSDTGPVVAARPATAPPPSSTRLSDLFGPADAKPEASSGSSVAPAQTTGSQDDPFARASVSYRGDDPAKIQRLQDKAQRCVRGAQATRLLLIINSEGYLVAKPRPISGAVNDKVAKTIAAVERCAPFADVGTPGPPRSYEINVG